MKNFIFIVLGVILGSITVYLIERVGHLIYPIPDNISPDDYFAIQEYVKNSPIESLLIIILGHSLGTCVAGFSTYFFLNKKRNPALISATILVFFTILNIVLVPFHPIWFEILDISSVTFVLVIQFLIFKNKK